MGFPEALPEERELKERAGGEDGEAGEREGENERGEFERANGDDAGGGAGLRGGVGFEQDTRDEFG